MASLLIHIGAGNHSSQLDAKYRKLLRNALSRPFTDASRIIETSPLTNTGYGSSLDHNGNPSCDCTYASIDNGKVTRLLSLANITDCAAPTLACQLVLDKLDAEYHPEGHKGQLGLLKPSALNFETARADYPEVPRENLVLARARALYSKYIELENTLRESEHLNEQPNEQLTEHKHVLGSLKDAELVNDTVGLVEIGDQLQNQVQISCSSGGNFLRPPGRISCAGIYGSGAAYGRSGNIEVMCLCTGNGDDIVKMGLGSYVSDRMAEVLLETEEWPDLATLMVEQVKRRSSSFDLQATDAHLQPIVYVGVVAVVRDGTNQRLVFCHSTESFYFGFRSNGNRETVLSRHPGPVGTFICGEYKM